MPITVSAHLRNSKNTSNAFLSLFLSFSHTQIYTHTHTHTHTLSLSLSLSFFLVLSIPAKMSLPAVKALCLVLPVVSGLSFPAPEPTSNSPDSSNPPPTAAPQTTPPPHLKHRRDGPVLSTYKMTEYPNMCGWEEGGVYDDCEYCSPPTQRQDKRACQY